MCNCLINNWIEVTGAIFALLYLLLEIKQLWPMWIVGIISSLFYIHIFYYAKLYAEMGLSSYYVIVSCYGLYCWKFRKTSDNKSIETTRINYRLAINLVTISILLIAALLYILIHHTDSPAPRLDAIIAALSIVATWMTTRKLIEHWAVWIFVNFLSVGLYVYLELYPTAVLFMIYGSLSFVGWMSWKKMLKQ